MTAPRPIRTKLDTGVQIEGWYQGKDTYLWIGDRNGEFIGVLGGGPLKRLCKAVLRHLEAG